MRLRIEVYPRCLRDAFVSYFTAFWIPTVYYFHLFVVIPEYYDVWGLSYNLHFIITHILFFNVCANLFGIVFVDTSTKGLHMSFESKTEWKYCEECKSLAPPRSWHCKICNVCILQRDHHCIFFSCCIGYDNHRYFIVSLFYLLLAAAYASFYCFFFYKDFLFEDFSTYSIMKFMFPILTMYYGYSKEHLYIMIIKILFFGTFGLLLMLPFQVYLMVKGTLTHERCSGRYDKGILKNVENVLGKRWYMVWIAPWVTSVQPGDGINWSHLDNHIDNMKTD